MTCPLCGDICRCSSGNTATPSRWLADDETSVFAATPKLALDTPDEEAAHLEQAAEIPTENKENEHVEATPEDSQAWRQEVAARLNRYNSRRKPRPPRYPSLRLRFEEEAPPSAGGASLDSVIFPPNETSLPEVLAFGFNGSAARAVDDSASGPPEAQASYKAPAFLRIDQSAQRQAPQWQAQAATPATTAKIIEFPRSWTPPTAPLDELAEPVMDRPRILDAPEVLPPPPALGGIAIDPAPQPPFEKRPGIDIPLQSASLSRRIFSAVIDDAIIAAACAVFGFIFWKITAFRPPSFQILGLIAGLSGALWAAYQYLLLVYAGTTPGLRIAGIRLARFDGSPACRRLRRWRVLASFLSAVSLGMGYAWILLDEDALCWHDRITRTYIATKRN